MKRAGEFYITKEDIDMAYMRLFGLSRRPENLPNAYYRRIAERTISSITDDIIDQITYSIEAETECGAKAAYEAAHDL